jgi:tetratricopeptide (TPR) repeat protein
MMTTTLLTAALAATLALVQPPPLPADKASKILSARNLGLAQLEEGKNKDARATFEKLGALVPNEALPWAGAAIAALREGELPECARLLERATKLGGERADLWALTAALEEARNHPEPARAALARAAAKDSRDLESRWRFIKSVEASGGASSVEVRAERKRLLTEILAASPANLPARLKLLVLELETTADVAAARANLAELDRLLADGDAKTRTFLAECRALLEKGDAKGASLKARVVENLQRVTPRYQQSLGELFTNIVGNPITRFSAPLEASLRPQGSVAIPVALRESKTAAEDPGVTLRRVDLKNNGTPEVYAIPAPYTQATFSDVDLDGDLDIYLSGGGRPDRLVRNNLDGTFTDISASLGEATEREVQSRKVIAGDFDRDGDPDFVTISDKGELLLRSNLRQGRLKTSTLGVSGCVDVAADDLNADGALDLAVLTRHGVVVLINQGNGTFQREESAATKALAGVEGNAILLADLDNDGFPDLIVGGAKGLTCFRRSGPNGFVEWPIAPKTTTPVDRMLALDVDHDGDLDLVLWHAGKSSVLTNDGGNANSWLDVVVEGLPLGSGKVNRAGVGALVEVKSGDLYVAKEVGLLPTHVGLGSHAKADVVRCVFPNGIPQNIFDAKARTVVREVQVLKGSCPFVYARNGSTGVWSFISDALGRAPIGLLYDGVHLAGADPNEWLFIDGGLLSPTADGKLLIDYTEELWEVAFVDEARLVAVDHPDGTLVVPNERTIPGTLEKKLFTVAEARTPRRAWSVAGGTTTDVTTQIREKDDLRVEPGRETAYQGVREEHALILDLGPLAPADRVVLYLNGWILYTDTSINVSISQRGDLHPFPPVLEVPDGHGGWRVVMESFGFPAGKTKTMPVELTGLLNTQDPRVRIRTTMAVFWDQAFLTVNDAAVPVKTTSLSPVRATLTERGFSRRVRETPDGPEVFVHDEVSTVPAWEDVPGLVTRLGDVTELLQKTDDRWVAFKGGDSIRIEYDATGLPPVPPGWRRDWILVSEGWDKDFDKNTVSGESVGPYPYHAMSTYPYPDDEPFPDPAFLREWVTRKVGPERFRGVLRDAHAETEPRP